MECPSIVNQKVCVEAKVTVEPEAEIGDVHACCVGKPRFEKCGKKSHGCTYMVSQMLCVRFPLTISATASAKPEGIVCGKPTIKTSYHDNDPCINETPCEEEVLCETMKKNDPCFYPASLFECMPEGKACAEERLRTRERYHCANEPHRKMMQACPLCFLPLLCLAARRSNTKHGAQEKSRYWRPIH